MQSIDIFGYNDYRAFLRDYYSQRKAVDSKFSHRFFSSACGFKSPSQLQMIINGDRNLSLQSLAKMEKGLKLSIQENQYFQTLVKFNQVEDLNQKSKMLQELIKIRSRSRHQYKLEKSKFEFLSKWYVVAIYVMIEMKGFKEDSEWISKRLRRRISPLQAQQAIELLERIDLIGRDEKGKIFRKAYALTVADDTRALAVFNYHQGMSSLSQSALQIDNQDVREFGGATLPIPKSQLTLFKEKIRNFRKEMNQLSTQFEETDEIYQLNLQFFPLTDLKGGEDET